MYGSPRKAKRLHFDVIPKHVDEYVSHLVKFEEQEEILQVENPVWHIHNGVPPKSNMPVTFGLLLNLASVSSTDDKSVLWGFISRYAPDATPQNSPLLDKLVEYAVSYYHDFIKPEKKFRNATEKERAAIEALIGKLRDAPKGASAEELQNMVYEVGKLHGFENLRDWFGALYEVMLGQAQGPRMGSFIALYGVEETIALATQSLARKDAA
jgi:lysyl-tRNA synthetase class 1